MLKSITDDKIAMFAEQWPLGTNVNDLANELGISPKFVYVLASNLGIRRERRQVSRTENRAKFLDPGFKILGRLSDVEKAYLAGIFDGEGCISVYQAKHRTKQSDKIYYSEQLSVLIGNTDVRLIEWLHAKIPEGTIETKRPGKLSRKVGYIWKLSTIPGAFFCYEIFPSLIIKRDEAELVGSTLRFGFTPLSREQRDHFKTAIRSFKDKSKVPSITQPKSIR